LGLRSTILLYFKVMYFIIKVHIPGLLPMIQLDVGCVVNGEWQCILHSVKKVHVLSIQCAINKITTVLNFQT